MDDHVGHHIGHRVGQCRKGDAGQYIVRLDMTRLPDKAPHVGSRPMHDLQPRIVELRLQIGDEIQIEINRQQGRIGVQPIKYRLREGAYPRSIFDEQPRNLPRKG